MKRVFVVMILGSIACLAGAQNKGVSKQSPHMEDDGAAIVYGNGGGFMISAPKGWIIDREVGKGLGVCCVYYPRGTTWDTAGTVMYPNIATKAPEPTTLREFMEKDLKRFREHDSEMSYEDAKDVPLKGARIAKVRLFHNVNRGSSEAVAYVDEEIHCPVGSEFKTRKGLHDSLPLLRSALQSYAYMDVHDSTGAK